MFSTDAIDQNMIAPLEHARSESIGLYVHFPWCVRICTYCDFDRQAHAFDLVPRYVRSLCTEMGTLPRAKVHSVFFGGGTPSLMRVEQVAAILDAARTSMDLGSDAEITLETNPDDTPDMDIPGLIAAGVNRVSMGVQCLDDRWLRLLGRRHSAAQARTAVGRLRAGGVQNLSLDLMFGLPGQTLDDWRRTLEEALALEPEHLSCYLLTIDQTVPLGRDVAAGRVSLPDDEGLDEQYRLTQSVLRQAGFEQYEISNWARQGRQSRHNLTYWRDEPFFGVGAGAASCWQGRRTKNTPVVTRYLKAVAGGRQDLGEDEPFDWQVSIRDHVALGLRLREGLDLQRLERRYGVRLEALAGDELRALAANGALELNAMRVRITESYLLVANEVIARVQAAIPARPSSGSAIRERVDLPSN